MDGGEFYGDGVAANGDGVKTHGDGVGMGLMSTTVSFFICDFKFLAIHRSDILPLSDRDWLRLVTT